MNIEWEPFALQDRIAIFDYIEADNPQAALSIDERIRAEVEVLAQFPELGRRGRVKDTRELVISNTPYIAVYRVMSDGVRILRVLHGARQWPEEFPGQAEPGEPK